jgi:hypothetical protein
MQPKDLRLEKTQNLYPLDFYCLKILKNIYKFSLHLSFMIISAIALSRFLLPSVTDTLAQFPQLNIKDKNTLSLTVTDAVYNANTSEFLGSKNISLTPYRTTEQHYIDEGFLTNVGNVTNSQTLLNNLYRLWKMKKRS